MNALHVDVKHGVRIDLHSRSAEYFPRLPFLVDPFDLKKFLLEGSVSAVFFNLSHLLQVSDPAFTHGSGKQRCQARIAFQYPAPRSDTIGLVAEPLRPELGKIRRQ